MPFTNEPYAVPVSVDNRLIAAHKSLREHPLWHGSLEQQDHEHGLLTRAVLEWYLAARALPDDALTPSEKTFQRELGRALRAAIDGTWIEDDAEGTG